MVLGSGGSQTSQGRHREHNERLCAENERLYGLRGAPEAAAIWDCLPNRGKHQKLRPSGTACQIEANSES